MTIYLKTMDIYKTICKYVCMYVFMKVPLLNHGIEHIENISIKVLAPLI